MELTSRVPVKALGASSRRRPDGQLEIVRRSRAYVLNETSELIWNACDGTKDLSQIAALLNQEYDVSLDDALADVREFVARLIDELFLEEADDDD
ncbi:PqqD family protein [Nocardia niwae]|uniref:PqqD family protein n=1 Tax=Nocardia niwae TaxID=626084 RepID=A0ABV2X943_9NOCA|nr:PqqD family protein [Nocardia niwae]